MDITTIVIIVALVVIGGFVIGVYNNLITLKNKVDEGWADIDTQLKRRYDLIPNMVETVKGYAKHEKETLENVTKARNVAMGATDPAAKAEAENMLSGALKTLFAVAENYPQLKADKNFLELQTTLKEIEEHIQLSRRYYNATVRDFNTKLEVFPNNIVAGMFGFKRRDFFEITEGERENVKVSFSEDDKGTEAADSKESEDN
ncbi:MAG: LemA family protein [Candidatus Gracilibacteria bacterium]|nr:LemA family protein [Candidatus Peregrinibacteria bacterium]